MSMTWINCVSMLYPLNHEWAFSQCFLLLRTIYIKKKGFLCSFISHLNIYHIIWHLNTECLSQCSRLYNCWEVIELKHLLTTVVVVLHTSFPWQLSQTRTVPNHSMPSGIPWAPTCLTMTQLVVLNVVLVTLWIPLWHASQVNYPFV